VADTGLIGAREHWNGRGETSDDEVGRFWLKADAVNLQGVPSRKRVFIQLLAKRPENEGEKDFDW